MKLNHNQSINETYFIFFLALCYTFLCVFQIEMTDASSPYEQGEIESTPERDQPMEEDEDSDISLSVHSKEAIDEEDHEESKKEDTSRLYNLY